MPGLAPTAVIETNNNPINVNMHIFTSPDSNACFATTLVATSTFAPHLGQRGLALRTETSDMACTLANRTKAQHALHARESGTLLALTASNDGATAANINRFVIQDGDMVAFSTPHLEIHHGAHVVLMLRGRVCILVVVLQPRPPPSWWQCSVEWLGTCQMWS